jgi:hypothetical protein
VTVFQPFKYLEPLERLKRLQRFFYALNVLNRLFKDPVGVTVGT